MIRTHAALIGVERIHREADRVEEAPTSKVVAVMMLDVHVRETVLENT